MDRYFKLTEESSVRILQIRGAEKGANGQATMTIFSARLGKVETSEQSKSMDIKEIDSNISQAIKHGFTEIDATSFEKSKHEAKQTLQKKAEEQADDSFHFLPWSEVRHAMKFPFQNSPTEYLPSPLQLFCVYDEPIHKESSLRIRFNENGPSPQTASRNHFFKSGLLIDGDLDAGDNTTSVPQFIYVNGDLHVRNLLLLGWAEVIVTGNLIVAETALCCDGESWGRLKVAGNFAAKNLIAGAMFRMEIKGNIETIGYYPDLDESPIKNMIKIPCNLEEDAWKNRVRLTPLIEDVYFEDTNWASGKEVKEYNLDFSRIVEKLRSGTDVFHHE